MEREISLKLLKKDIDVLNEIINDEIIDNAQDDGNDEHYIYKVESYVAKYFLIIYLFINLRKNIYIIIFIGLGLLMVFIHLKKSFIDFFSIQH